MIVLKVTAFLLVLLTVGAEKKIELQDIEEDNLRSEKDKDVDKSDNGQTESETGPGLVPLEFLKSGLLRYFENPTPQPQVPQQQRYVHQYAVTEPPERPPTPPKPHFTSSGTQQAMVGYLSNVPMQIYLVPQYYTESEQAKIQPGPPYQTPSIPRVNGYQPEAVQSQTNYIGVPSYTPPTGKAYVPQYTPQITYVFPTQAPTPQPASPVVAYQPPVVQYQSVLPTSAPKVYYQSPQYESNTVDEVQEHEEEQKYYTSQAEIPYQKPSMDFPRYYNSRTPIRDEYRQSTISELPHPNPLIFKSAPPHLAHIPKTLPMYRPLTKPVYQPGGSVMPHPFTHRPHEAYGPSSPFKRRPTSLLDSYIPSSLQVEYLKRGLVKDPLDAYDAIASGRVPHPIPRHYERGFLPNQMYHTGAGAVTFGHYKRTPKIDKVTHK